MAAGGAQQAPRVLGLTGPIACGKTTVGDILLDLGAIERIDADRVVHELMAAGTETTARIRAEFGPDVLRDDGAVDRRCLGEIVFGDPDALRRLEAIVHPAVRSEVRARVERLAGRRGVVVIDAVKLLQSELLALTDAVWVVACSEEAQLQRLTGSRGLSREAARARLAAMPPFDHPKVTARMRNDTSMDALRAAVTAEWGALLERWHMQPVGEI